MIDKEFVPYEEAVALKQLGFDERCFGSWEIEYTKIPTYTHCISDLRNSNHPVGKTTAPTFSQVFRWFRDKYQIDSWIFPNLNGLYSVSIIRRGVGVGKISEYQIYEEAELACLKRLIEIVKEKNK